MGGWVGREGGRYILWSLETQWRSRNPTDASERQIFQVYCMMVSVRFCDNIISRRKHMILNII